jgi:hypothetical protein
METSLSLDPLLIDIEAYLGKTGMSAQAFGRATVNDSGFLTTLRRGREVRRKTRQRVLQFIQDHPTGLSQADR